MLVRVSGDHSLRTLSIYKSTLDLFVGAKLNSTNLACKWLGTNIFTEETIMSLNPDAISASFSDVIATFSVVSGFNKPNYSSLDTEEVSNI